MMQVQSISEEEMKGTKQEVASEGNWEEALWRTQSATSTSALGSRLVGSRS
jgi:hypothetical protein